MSPSPIQTTWRTHYALAVLALICPFSFMDRLAGSTLRWTVLRRERDRPSAAPHLTYRTLDDGSHIEPPACAAMLQPTGV